MSTAVPETVAVTVDEHGILQEFNESGTGLCSDTLYQVGDLLTLHVRTLPQQENGERLSTMIRFEVLWSRQQDEENILAMCVRQLIFNTYEQMNFKIDAELLGLLYNKSTNSTQRLIEIYGLNEPQNRAELDELITSYHARHPDTNYRYGARVLENYLDNWKQVLGALHSFLPEAQVSALQRKQRSAR